MSRSKTKAVPVRWSDEQFQRFAETVPDATVYVDEHGKILLVNRQLEEWFDYRREQLVGQSISMLIPQRFHGRISIPGSPDWDDSRRSWQRRGMGISGVRRGGAEFPAEISVRPIES